jgi:hypothetical protein
MMDENINESAEIQEVAEPETETSLGAEEQEVAAPDTAEDSYEVAEEPTHQRTEMDAAFAEMRRQNQQLEREAKMMREALSTYFEGDTAEELSINAHAYAQQRDPEEYRAEWEKQQDYERALQENEELHNMMLEMEVDRLMRDGLREVQEIDPNIKSLDELGEPFVKMIGAGLTTKEAYYATLAMNSKEKVFAPSPIGKVSDNRIERDYYTSEEIDNLTDEELDDPVIWEKVMKSMSLLGKAK